MTAKYDVDFTSQPVVTPLGQLKSVGFATGDSISRSYDTNGRMTGNEFASYGYDAAGRMTGITQSLASTSGSTSLSWSIGYDSRDRVTSFARAGAASSYTYDANSNRLTSAESYTSDSDLDGSFTSSDATLLNAKALDIASASNRLLGFTQTVTRTNTGSGTSVVTTPVAYSLDANGAMTSDGLRTFDYDESGRLAKVRILQGGEAASVSYLTNGLGQRVFKGEVTAEQTLPEETTLGVGFVAWLKSKFRWMFESAQATTSIGTAYTYAEGGLPGWALLGEYDNGSASGTGRTEYIWLPTPDGNAIPIGMYRNSRFYTIHADHLGTPRLVKDDTNTPVWQWPYSAFGNNRPVGVLSSTSTTGYTVTAGATPLKATQPDVPMNLRFPGQYADSETGEFYNYFRQYDPRVGRYTQADPIGMDGGWNRFGYVDASPLSSDDELGLQPNTRTQAPRPAPTYADIANASRVDTLVTNIQRYDPNFRYSTIAPRDYRYSQQDVNYLSELLGQYRGAMRCEVGGLGRPTINYGSTPNGVMYTRHYGAETGPVRNLPGSLLDSVIATGARSSGANGSTIYYDPINNVTVVVGSGGIMSAHKN